MHHVRSLQYRRFTQSIQIFSRLNTPVRTKKKDPVAVLIIIREPPIGTEHDLFESPIGRRDGGQRRVPPDWENEGRTTRLLDRACVR